MTMRSLSTLAVAIGLTVGGTAAAQQAKPAKPVASANVDDNKLVAMIAERLNQSAVTRGTDISVTSKGGIVTVLGDAENGAQKQAVLQVIQYTKGVVAVRDGINTSKVKQTQGPSDVPNTLPNVTPEQPSTPTPLPMTPLQPSEPIGPIVNAPSVGVPPTMYNGPVGNPAIEPMPMGMAGMGGPAMAGSAPPLPPYAWPTYAPHNNFSRVAYPQAYPANAFPFIGPYYPFPKVPMGWRSVRLEFDDGFWWMGRKSAPHDYWRVRFW